MWVAYLNMMLALNIEYKLHVLCQPNYACIVLLDSVLEGASKKRLRRGNEGVVSVSPCINGAPEEDRDCH